VVGEIITEAWNTINEVEVAMIDKNVFLFTFKHEVDVWDRRPWNFKGKKYNPGCSLSEIDFSISDFWVQIHGLPLDRQNEVNLKRLGGILGTVLEVDLAGNGTRAGCRFVRVRVGLDVNLPLKTGFPLERDKLPVLWIPFKFEKLGSFCYSCGVLGYDIRGCPDPENQRRWSDRTNLGVFRNWLRAESRELQPGTDLGELRSSDMAECSRKMRKEKRTMQDVPDNHDSEVRLIEFHNP
jgi:hypothetical protein